MQPCPTPHKFTQTAINVLELGTHETELDPALPSNRGKPELEDDLRSWHGRHLHSLPMQKTAYESGCICYQTFCCCSSRHQGRSPVICDTEPAAREAAARKPGERATAAKAREEVGRSGNDTRQTK